MSATMNQEAAPPTMMKPVVIYRLGSLGDTVVALPCFHRIERSFPDSERIALTNFPVNSKASALGTILGTCGLIGRSMAYPVGLRSLKGFWNLRKELLAIGSDTLVYLTPPRGLRAAWRDRIFFRLCGFKRIIGIPLSPDLQRNRVEADGNFEPEYSRMARCIATLGPIDLEAPSSWDLRFSATERSEAREICAPLGDAPFFAINMGGKAAEKDWGVDNWMSLIARLGEPLAGHGLLILGAAEDSPRARVIAERWKGPVVDACGRLSPRVSGAAATGARLFVGHDSGPLHLCACVGVPCVALFGNGNKPRTWHPHGSEHKVIHNMQGVMSITVTEVVEAAQAILARSPAPSTEERV